jgi:nucleotide-binding universal stress UspA family protein
MSDVVVGIDGSVASAEALRWAVHSAGDAGAELTILHVWDVPSVLPGIDLAVPGLRRDLAEIAKGTVDDAVAAARSMGDEELVVHGEMVCGSASRMLTEASRSADLLVVGNIGHSMLTGLLLGSVADSVVRHAHCPVAVIPLPRDG